MSWRVYDVRGFLSLLVRIREYLIDFFSALFFQHRDVLYVSGCPGGSRFYRCNNQSEELLKYGISANIISQGNSYLVNLVKKHKVFIFQRVIFNEHIERVMNEIFKQKKYIIFETDDLVFNPEYLSFMHYYNYMGKEEKGWYENGIGREILEDSKVKNCIVSTQFLANEVISKYPDKYVYILENRLNKNQVLYANNAYKNIKNIKIKDGKIRIGYFSGSKSHDADFSSISDVLVRILTENKNLVLMIVGYLRLGDKFEHLTGQIEYYSFVPMKKLPSLMMISDINIAPLEMHNPFCQCKSALKFLEAGILGIPTIASATDSFQRAIENNNDGFLVFTENDWYEKLSLLINNESLRNEIGNNARLNCLEKYTTQSKNLNMEKFSNFIKTL